MAVDHAQRRLSAGVEIQLHGGAHARVWAPGLPPVEVVARRASASRCWPLAPAEADGYFAGELPDAQRRRPLLVPARWRSRCGPIRRRGISPTVRTDRRRSSIPSAFRWTDAALARHRSADGQVLYEMHVGTFTPRRHVARGGRASSTALADLGITVVEMMPVADFAGRFGWGYDGVDLYAPTRLYGTPDDLRAFVDRAHALGLGVILDVVYNHLGPDGNYLADFSPDYFTDATRTTGARRSTSKGRAPARAFFVENAGYWIDEFHFDGLRLDATQDIHDASPRACDRRADRAGARATAGAARDLHRRGERAAGHAARARSGAAADMASTRSGTTTTITAAVVALTGQREAYYRDYTGSAQEFVSCAKYGYLYQGQWYRWQKQRARNAGARPAAARVRHLSRESRPGRQHRVRPAAAPA